MNVNLEKITKYSVYSLGILATIATSPLYVFYGTMGFDTVAIDVDETTEFIPLSATSSTSNPKDKPIEDCGWEALFELSETLSDDTEMVIWKLDQPWDQAAFDEAYALALAEAETESEDTGGGEDTGSYEDTGTGGTSDTVADTGWDDDNDYDPTLSEEHQVFYDTLMDFGDNGYRVVGDGELWDVSISRAISFSGLQFYEDCSNSEGYFVITIKGEPTTTSMDVSIQRHEGIAEASKTLSCGRNKGPNYDSVEIEVELRLSE